MCRSTTLPDNLAATGSELVGAKMGVFLGFNTSCFVSLFVFFMLRKVHVRVE